MTSDDTEYATRTHHAICPLCVRVVSKEDKEELEEVIHNHNVRRHDGDTTAEIVAAEELDDFMDRVREKYNPEVRHEIGQHVVDVDPWGIL